ncbi:peptidylprolyl isomerase [Modestobacter italicus]|uniref:peptidylprolyl isomerase n=1 Tax=Modestobacter italicus (strain DSM 44449 / CECT 9708 / BC 501) TaxID=2732864 RepID=UPI001C9761D5|nr:peptidylprolyl isomerase [Modestobacter italicus]
MSRRRVLVVLLVGAVGLGGLTGCRTAPSVAAYVGETQVSVAELDDAVATRLADPDIAAFVGEDEAAFTRQVLSLRVTEAVHAAAARRLDVEVTDAQVRDRIEQLLDGSDPAAVFAQVAQQQGASEADVVENVRQQLIRQRLAAAAGEADLSEEGLRARFEQVRGSLGQVELGLVTVPDQVAADAALAQLTADPAAYPAVAAQYAGPNTLPQIEPRSPADLPEVLAAEITRTAPGQGFTVAVPQAGGVVVGFVRAVAQPTFDEVRDQLAEQALAEADAVGQQLVSAVRDDLDVVVNPRYGELTEGQVVPADGGVVQLLADVGGASAGD